MIGIFIACDIKYFVSYIMMQWNIFNKIIFRSVVMSVRLLLVGNFPRMVGAQRMKELKDNYIYV